MWEAHVFFNTDIIYCNIHLRNETKKRRVKLIFVHDIRWNETGYNYYSWHEKYSTFWVFPNKVYDQYANSVQMQVTRQIPRLNHALHKYNSIS